VLKQARAAGADLALVSGSGPTVIGLFADGAGGAEHAAQRLRERAPAPISATPVEESFARAATVDE
jgi:4-diphosphocytidyl-2-C-methyl-D-erythritol kinase